MDSPVDDGFQAIHSRPAVQVEEHGLRIAVCYESSHTSDGRYMIEAETEDGEYWERRRVYRTDGNRNGTSPNSPSTVSRCQR